MGYKTWTWSWILPDFLVIQGNAKWITRYKVALLTEIEPVFGQEVTWLYREAVRPTCNADRLLQRTARERAENYDWQAAAGPERRR